MGGIKCGIRDFIGRSEGRLEGGGRLWLLEWLLKGAADETEIERIGLLPG